MRRIGCGRVDFQFDATTDGFSVKIVFIVDEHTRGREAHTLSGLTTEIGHLRTALNAIAATVRRREEELRRLRKPQH